MNDDLEQIVPELVNLIETSEDEQDLSEKLEYFSIGVEEV